MRHFFAFATPRKTGGGQPVFWHPAGRAIATVRWRNRSRQAESMVRCDFQSSTMGGSGCKRNHVLASTGSGRNNQDWSAKNPGKTARMPFFTENAANLIASLMRSVALNFAGKAVAIIATQTVAKRVRRKNLYVKNASRFGPLLSCANQCCPRPAKRIAGRRCLRQTYRHTFRCFVAVAVGAGVNLAANSPSPNNISQPAAAP